MPKSPDSLADEVLKFLSKPSYRPLKDHELARALHVHDSQRNAFRATIRNLEQAGRIKRLRGNRWAKPDTSREMVGRLSVNVHGLGFVTPDQPGHPDVAIERDGLGSALHGDVVAVELRGRLRPGTTDARIAGRITRIVERRTRTIAGLLRRSKHYWYVIPENPRFPQDVRVREFAFSIGKPAEHHQVVVELDPSTSPADVLAGVVTEDLGSPDQPGVDMVSILRSHNLEQEFDDKVLHEAQQQSPELSAADLVGRLDLRKTLICTIDPEDAKDFDDAVSLEKTPDGHWQLGVHIADVAHFVHMNTPVDHEARQRGNSVYMVDRFIPMLPKYLTSDVCSLRPHVDRLTHSALLTLDAEGRIVRQKTARTVIHSAVRLTYDQVQLFMDGRDHHGIPENILPALRDMARLAERVRENRMDAGALDLSMPEVKCVLDADGRVLDIHKRGAPEAYHLIEEFMLLANVAVANALADKEIPALYRIHEPPSDEQWAKMAEDLNALEIRAAPRDRHDIQRVTRAIAATPLEYAGNLAVLRNLKRAVYSSELVEHFGLAFDKYTHFTSPIRRYPDLVVHRILNALEQRKAPPYSHDEVERLAAHCSDTERNADEAEEESLTVKRVEFYSEKLKKGEIGPYDALITSIVSRGLIVELVDTLQRGLVAFATITDDYYTHDRERGRAVGQRRRKIWKLGQLVSVELINVDKYRRLIDFRLAGPVAPEPAPRPREMRRQKRQRRR